jgi:ABC-2 type transport system ATP-binding protein
MQPVISVKNIAKYYQVFDKEPGLWGAIKSVWSRKYREVKAVDKISFSIEEGELVGFIGPNGAGKTTTLKVLSGLLYPTSGSVKVLGFTPFERKPEFLKSISLVMGQKNQLWWELPAMDTFKLNQAIYEIPDSEFETILSEFVQLLGIQELLHVPVRKLSLGQRMKMELVAALLHKPKVLFLDEPTIGLDVVTQKTMRDFIKDYNQKYKATILLTSHYMADVRYLAKRIIIIDHGKIIYDGQIDKIVQKFAKEKIINVVFSNKPDLKKLEGVATILEYSYPKITLAVSRDKVKEVAIKILHDFPVLDITIEETPIEDVVRAVFSKEKR